MSMIAQDHKTMIKITNPMINVVSIILLVIFSLSNSADLACLIELAAANVSKNKLTDLLAIIPEIVCSKNSSNPEI